MNAEISTLSRSSQTTKTSSAEKITILVVDDDSTCLAIVAAILKAWKYEVVTVKHAIDALCTLRIKGGSFDLVVTDVHMPDMNGFELQKQIHEEFNLPVVLMSADDKEAVILHGLESGAAFFLVKPVSSDDLKNLWQYAFAKKRGKAGIRNSGSVRRISLADHRNETPNEDIDSASSVNEETRKKVSRSNRDEKGDENDDSATPKKAKVVWTNALHNQFLEAIRTIGLESAVPKKILEIMNVPGLTRENVASHLQKYRIFLKRVADASYNIQSDAERSLLDRTLEQSLNKGQPLLMMNKLRTPLPQRFTNPVPVVKAPDIVQSRLLRNQANLEIENEGSLYQLNCSSLTTEVPNGYQRGFSSCGGVSIGLMNGSNSSKGLSKYNTTTVGNLSNSKLNSAVKCSKNNYAAYRIASGGQIVGTRHIANSSGIQNGFVNNVPLLSTGNGTHYLLQDASSSAKIASSDQFFSTFPDRIDHQENVLVPERPLTMQQQNSLCNEGENDDYIAGLVNPSTLHGNYIPQDEADFSSSLVNLQQAEEEILNSGFTFSSHDIQDNPIFGNHQALEQQHVGEQVLNSTLDIDGYKSDDYCPWLDQNPKQQQGLGELVNSEDHGMYQSNNNIMWNHMSPSQLDDEIFIQSMFSPDAFAGNDSLGGL